MNRYHEGKKISIISIISNIILAAIKLIIGFLVGSAGLIADGFHSVSDTFSTVAVLIAIKIADQPPDEDHPYGHGQAEPIAAKILGLILMFTGIILIYKTANQILLGSYDTIGLKGFWVAIFSILVKEGLFRYTYKIGEKTNNQALKADAWHHRSDAISSIASAIGILGAYFGYAILDPVAGVIVALMIIKVGWNIVRDAVSSLMGTAPSNKKLNSIREIAKDTNGVEAVSELKAHYYGIDLYVDLKVLVDYRLTVLEGHEIAARVKERISNKHSETREVLVHVDPMLPEINNS
ncbi:MAG: cation diffusion facilitator family transporter [Halanaerobiales bacterium]